MTNIDSYGRTLDYLRVAVTDRCNLRCVYCMPSEGVPAKSHDEILRFEQITALVAAAAGIGFRKIRLTGGEPLARRGIVDLVRALAGLPGIEEVAMTTNGTAIARLANDLAAAGLSRVNISLDSLREDRFRSLTRLGSLSQVLEGLAACEAAGLRPIKINVVVVRGVNDDEVTDFARLTYEHDWHVRFIEVMPLDGSPDWGPDMPPAGDRFVPAAEMQARLADLGPLQPDAGPGGQGPARYFRLPGARGTIGFINPMSEHFCAGCNRMRLTADGWLRTCLFADTGVLVKPALDRAATQSELELLLRQAIDLKPETRPLVDASAVTGRAMSMIGG